MNMHLYNQMMMMKFLSFANQIIYHRFSAAHLLLHSCDTSFVDALFPLETLLITGVCQAKQRTEIAWRVPEISKEKTHNLYSCFFLLHGRVSGFFSMDSTQ
jgi:hypothetical protein